jgi:hypothetical protein
MDPYQSEVKAVVVLRLDAMVPYISAAFDQAFVLSDPQKNDHIPAPIPKSVKYGVSELNPRMFMTDDKTFLSVLFLHDYIEYVISELIVDYHRPHCDLFMLMAYLKDEYKDYLREDSAFISNLSWIESTVHRSVSKICAEARIDMCNACYYLRRDHLSARTNHIFIEIRDDYRIIDWYHLKQKEKELNDLQNYDNRDN